MALRLISLARMPSLLVPKVKPAQPQVRYLLKRDRLVPFVDEVPTVFSIPAIKHHWGAIPIIVISGVAVCVEVIWWLKIALTRHDVSYTANSAFYESQETRQGPWYKPTYRKFVRFNQKCETPRGVIEAQGDPAGESLCVDNPQVIPIIGVCTFALIMKITVIILMGFKKDDVWFTKGSARCEDFETRSGPWYKAKSRKWGGRDDYPVPAEALLARQGDTNGPPFPADDDDDDSDNGLSATEVAVHVGVTTGVIGVATFLAA